MAYEFWFSAAYSEGVIMRDEISSEIAEAFDSDLADAVSEFSGKRVIKGIYDPITGTAADTVINYTGRGVFGSYALSLVDGESILSTDQKLTTLQAEVTDVPLINDKINGFTVISVSKDPANVSWIIQLRA